MDTLTNMEIHSALVTLARGATQLIASTPSPANTVLPVSVSEGLVSTPVPTPSQTSGVK